MNSWAMPLFRNFTDKIKLCTNYSTTPIKSFVNRNPRNLERLRIARKPQGYQLDKPGRTFWHRLEINTTGKQAVATVRHFLNGPVLEVSSGEWAIRKQLYSAKDMSAFINLGRVFAQRCLEFGLTEMSCDIQPLAGGKVEQFLEEVKNGGVTLTESPRYKHPNAWDRSRPEKPWEVLD